MTKADIIIVGAGIAGLGAAKALKSRGLDVIILEARSRTGGRIHTLDGFDYGAHWIHGTEGNPLTNLARGLGLPTYFVGGDSTYTGGWDHMVFPGRSEETKDPSIMLIDSVLDQIDADRSSSDRDRSMAEAADRAMDALGLSSEERTHVRWHLNLHVREDCATDPENLSSRFWDDGYEVFGYGDSLFLEGYQSLTDRLAEGLDIRLNTEVHTIRHSSSGVSVATKSGDFRADQVLVTVPLGVLKSGAITFIPALPTDKQGAIDRLGVGTLAKIGLTFSDPFWPPNTYVFGLPGGSERGATVAINKGAVDGSHELILLAGGSLGVEVEAMEDASASDWALAQLAAAFGHDVPQPVKMRRTNWSNDPFARGSYCCISTDARAGDTALLSVPVGDHLFFAGEATSATQWATAHGAYLSGLREAARITGDPSLIPPQHFAENRRFRAQMMRASRFFNMRVAEIAPEELADRTALLARSAPFAEIELSELRSLATMFEVRNLSSGDWLCREGEKAEHVYLVEEGLLDIHQDDSDTAIARIGRGALSGEYGLFHDAKRTASIKAATTCRVLVLDYQRFERFLLAFPQASLALLRTVVARVTE